MAKQVTPGDNAGAQAVPTMASPSNARHGLLYALGAYGVWGVFPIYWKMLEGVPPLELLAHRVLWASVTLLAVLAVRRRWGTIIAALRDPSVRRAMTLSTLLVSVNWGIFIWAVNTGHVLAASMGYYINPLLNVVLGRLVLREELRPAQIGAALLASVGVINLGLAQGQVPWVSLLLAATFAFYGLVRKTAAIDALPGLAVETTLLAPVALLFLVLTDGAATVAPMEPWRLALLLGSGAATSIPLVWFAEAARRLRYSTLGIVQYLSPTCQLILAVVLFDEPFTRAHALTFACIWSAVLLYTLDTLGLVGGFSGWVRARLRS